MKRRQTSRQGAVSIRKTVLPGMAIPMLKIRRPLGRLIFNMGIVIPGKTVFLIETAPSSPAEMCTNKSGTNYALLVSRQIHGSVENSADGLQRRHNKTVSHIQEMFIPWIYRQPFWQAYIYILGYSDMGNISPKAISLQHGGWYLHQNCVWG